jgi:SAM-dependent methyltransferase
VTNPTPEHHLRDDGPRTRAVPLEARRPEAPTGYLPRVFHATEEENRRAILRALPRKHGGSVLDIGTHVGDFTTRVAERLGAKDVYGVELIEKHAAEARSRGIKVEVGDIEKGLPFPDRKFDAVHANQVIEHLRDTDLLVTEIRRVLKPGGIACISTNNLSSWHNVWSLVFGYQPFPMHVSDALIVGNPLNPEHGQPHEDAGRIHVRVFTGRALAELCSHHGLPPIRMRSAGYYPLPPKLGRIAARVDPRHGAFLVGLFRRAD